MAEENYKIFVPGHMASQDSESKAKARRKAHEKSEKPVVITPAKTREELRKNSYPGRRRNEKIRVAAYCRVSTPSESQVQSIENQKAHFEDLVSKREDWELVGIYADEGISGTYRKRRKAFNEMIDACHRGEIDMIIIKDVARYTRNIVDGLEVARELRSLTPPVGIYFETLDLNTLRPDYETLLAIMTTCCQLESTQKSESMKWSYKHRFENGRLPCPTFFLLGYDSDEDGKMVINEEEAKTVRVIFFAYCLGYSASDIAQLLSESHRRTGWKGKDEEGNVVYNTNWSRQTVLNILRNERYCGDALGQKTYTLDALTHRKMKNKGEYPTYFVESHHDGIVSHEVFDMAQRILRAEAFRHKEKMISLTLTVVQKGLLRGFIPLSVFSACSDYTEYIELSNEVGIDEDQVQSIEIPKIGGFLTLRSEFTKTSKDAMLTITGKKITPNSTLLKLMREVEYFEILLHPKEYLLAVRKTSANNPNAVRWADWSGNSPKLVNAQTGSMSESIYDLMNWERDWKFTCTGYHRTKGKESIVIFDLRDTIAYVPTYEFNVKKDKHVFSGWNNPIFPFHWKNKPYGESLFEQITKCRMHLVDYFNVWDVNAKATPIKKMVVTNPVTIEEYKEKLAELTPQGDREQTTA